jgi:hypothetical protein
MRSCYILGVGLVTGWLYTGTANAQFGQNTPQAPPNTRFLPRVNNGYPGNASFSPFNNYYGNGAFGGNAYQYGYGGYGWNSWGGSGFSPYGSPYSGFGNPWQYGMGGYNNYAWGAGAPFGGYQFGGYGNFAPIVGVNNGWWPYQPAYDYNNPVNQALQNLYIQGLTGQVTGPSPRR